jgi:hypothetical protein
MVLIKLGCNSFFGDPTRARERTEIARERERERETASNYVEALDHSLAEKVNKGELVKLRSTDLFDLYGIPKDQLRGDTLRAMVELEPTVSDWKGSGMRTTFSRQAQIDSAPSSPAETKTDLKDEVTPDRGSRTEYTRTSCGRHDLVTPDKALRPLSNPSTNSAQTGKSADTGFAKDLACTENVSGEAINAAKRFIYGRHAASWRTSSTPSKDREKKEKQNLSFCGSTKHRASHHEPRPLDLLTDWKQTLESFHLRRQQSCLGPLLPKVLLSGEANNAAKSSLYGRHAASWCPSSTPSKDGERQEKLNISFSGSTKNRTGILPPIPHISAWWNSIMYKSR